MNALPDNKIIIACATGLEANSAISIIRISGGNDYTNFNEFFSINLDSIKVKEIFRTKILDKDIIVDDAMAIYYKAPKSYTGENLFEIFVHGNIYNVKRIINLFLKNNNIRLALPGEFTYRAVKNKKMTISQTEGLNLFLNAVNDYTLRQGLEILQGDLFKKFIKLKEKFYKLRAAFELLIDFSEDIGASEGKKQLNNSLSEFEDILNELANKSKIDSKTVLRPQIVICGPPNAGKSTLFNLLVQKDRAIISSIKGTTRDYITEEIEINSNMFIITDTAGVRITNDTLESKGIEKTIQQIHNSFYKILVINPCDYKPEELYGLGKIQFDLLVYTHQDSKQFQECINNLKGLPVTKNIIKCSLINVGPIEPENKIGPIEPENKIGPIEPENKIGPIEPENKIGPIEPENKIGPIEPENKIGPIEPSKKIKTKINEKYLKTIEKDPIIIERHKQKILDIALNYLEFKRLFYCSNDIGILSSELLIINKEIEELIGAVPTEEILNSIFDNFCIGK